MKITNHQDAIHRSHLYRVLIAVADNPFLAKTLIFKGGTCAALLKKLDRFSVDLDFDISPHTDQKKVATHFKKIFTKLNLTIKDNSQRALQYYLKYNTSSAHHNPRNTLKIDAVNTIYKSDTYTPQFLPDIDRYLICQNIETMFSHKLVALTDRYKKHHSIAGRDLYDIHHFFMQGYSYNPAIITERTSLVAADYLQVLLKFINQHISQTIIDQDLNMLLPYDSFKVVRKSIKIETTALIKDEIERLSKNN